MSISKEGEMREEAREKIAEIISEYSAQPYTGANRILSLEGDTWEIAVVEKDAKPPDNEVWHKDAKEFEAFCAGRNIMVMNGWVKKVKE